MFQPGIASELSRLAVRERIGADSARDRLLLNPDPRPTSERRFDRALSAAGAVAFLGLVLFGPIGVLVSLGVVALGVAILGVSRRGSDEGDGPTTDDRWQLWRRVEPDLEYLRPRRRAA